MLQYGYMNILPVERSITVDLERRQRALSPTSERLIPVPLLSIDEQPETISAMADFLATPAVELSSGDLLYPPILDKRELYEKAIAVREELDRDLEEQAATIKSAMSGSTDRWDAIDWALKQTERGEWAKLEACGIKLDPGWISDITRSMLRNRPVEIQIAETNRPRVIRNSNGEYSLSYDGILDKQLGGVALAAMLQRIDTGFDYTRPVVQVDNLIHSNEYFAAQALHRQHALQVAYQSLRSRGAIGEHDRPGTDFILIPQTRNEEQVGMLLDRLQDSEMGLMVTSANGAIYFRPDDRISTSVTRQYSTNSDQLAHDGVLLQEEDGTPTVAARNAASYLNPINTRFTHVTIRDVHFVDLLGKRIKTPETDQELSMILQSLNITHADRNHTIYHDSRLIPPEYTAYALTRILRNEVDRIATSLKELDDVQIAMKPKEYFDHNYRGEKGTWPEDIQGAHVIGSELPRHYNLGEIKSAAVIGFGPFSYPALALAPFMKKGATMDISDLLPGNIEFAQEWFDGTANDEHASVYRTFANLFKEGHESGHFYQDCEELLKAAGNLHVAALEDLVSDSFQIVIESFVSCSNNIEKYGFHRSLEHKARILQWGKDSMMISVHMVGSDDWSNSGDDEGIKIPAANLSLKDIRNGYTSVGMNILRCVHLHADSSFREGHKGMVVIFAKPYPINKPPSILT